MKNNQTKSTLCAKLKIGLALLCSLLLTTFIPNVSRADDLTITNAFEISQSGGLYVMTNGTINVPQFDNSLGTLYSVYIVVEFPTHYWKTTVAPNCTPTGSTGYSEWHYGILDITNSVIGDPVMLTDDNGYTYANPYRYQEDGTSVDSYFGSGTLSGHNSGEWTYYDPNIAPYYNPHVLLSSDNSEVLADVTGNGNLPFYFGTDFDAGLRLNGGPTPGERYLEDSGGHFIGTIRIITTYSYLPPCCP